MAECYENTHVWPDDYVDGDTCNCGELYLMNTTPPRVVRSDALTAAESRLILERDSARDMCDRYASLAAEALSPLAGEARGSDVADSSPSGNQKPSTTAVSSRQQREENAEDLVAHGPDAATSSGGATAGKD